MQKIGRILFQTFFYFSAWYVVAQDFDFNPQAIELPQQSVTATLQDQSGYLWLGTGTGLVRFDGYQSAIYLHQPAKPETLVHNHILSLLETNNGDIWIGTLNGISRYLGHDKFASYLHDPHATERTAAHYQSLTEFDNTVWLHSRNAIWRFDTKSDRFEAVGQSGGTTLNGIQRIRSESGYLFAATNEGLFKLSPATKQFEAFFPGYPVSNWLFLPDGSLYITTPAFNGSKVYLRTADGRVTLQPALQGGWQFFRDQQARNWLLGKSLFRLNDNAKFVFTEVDDASFSVNSMLESRDGLLVSTTKQVLRYVPSEDKFVPMTVNNTNLTGQLNALSSTRDGTVFLSTAQSGLLKWVPNGKKFMHYKPPRFSVDGGLGGIGVRNIFEEKVNNQIWLWTSNSGVLKKQILDADGKPTGVTDMYPLPYHDTNGFDIHSILRTKNGVLLLATSQGLLTLNEQKSEFQQHHLATQLPATKVSHQPNKKPMALTLFESGNCIFLATNNGIGCIEPDLTRMRQWYGSEQYPALADNGIWQIYPAQDGALWLSSERGLLRLDTDKAELTQFLHDPDNSNSLGHNWVHGVWQTDSDTFWVATRESGLNQLIWQQNQPPRWRRFGITEGLPTEVIYAVAGDDAGQLWCASSHGIFRFTPKTGAVRVYDLADGLQSSEFNYSVFHKGRSGSFYFGGINGVNGFKPEQVIDDPNVPILQLTHLQANGTSLFPEDEETTLSYQKNSLTFDYLGLHFADPSRIRYAYKLVGSQQDWQYVTERTARFPALQPGSYDFWLKAANPDGHWSEPKLMYSFTLKPHPMLSWQAYLCYLALFVMLLLAYKKFRDRIERQQQLKIEQGITRESVLMRDLQLQFQFTAHEMRTPLMRLQLQLDQAQSALTATPAKTAGFLQGAHQAVQALKGLLQRHMEIEALKLNNNNNKIHLAADMVVGAEAQRYTAYAREKNQMLDIRLQQLAFYGLPGVLDLITANLLSNAIKYTPPGGTVSIELTQETAQLCLSVKDSGQGIPLDEHEKIFLRHYRRSGQENIAGTGEGLFLVKTCVECAGGSIELISEPNAGSCFTIRLPLGDLRQISTPEYKPSQLMLLPPHSSTRISTPEPCLTPTLSATILLVEDNDDLRNDISGLLQSHYHCVTASDGNMGFELATKLLPDLIISDVMMEHHDSGLRMLTQLKSQLQTSHIPVILLTALSNEAAQADGYQAAACLYLNKPVSSQLLLNAVASVLEQYRSMTKGVRAALQPVNSKDDGPTELFRLKLNAVFASVYTDASVNVETLAGYFHKSASQLNRICKSELGVTLIDGLNAYRVAQACQLMLSESQYSIETISEKCGFGCVKTMQRQFVKQVKMTPAEYRHMQQNLK